MDSRLRAILLAVEDINKSLLCLRDDDATSDLIDAVNAVAGDISDMEAGSLRLLRDEMN